GYSTKLFLIIAVPAAGGLFVLSQSIIRLFSTSDFLAGGTIVLIVSLSSLCLGYYQLNLYSCLLRKENHLLLVLTVIAAIVNVGINILLLPSIGIIGAALSTLAAYLILALVIGF